MRIGQSHDCQAGTGDALEPAANILALGHAALRGRDCLRRLPLDHFPHGGDDFGSQLVRFGSEQLRQHGLNRRLSAARLQHGAGHLPAARRGIRRRRRTARVSHSTSPRRRCGCRKAICQPT